VLQKMYIEKGYIVTAVTSNDFLIRTIQLELLEEVTSLQQPLVLVL